MWSKLLVFVLLFTGYLCVDFQDNGSSKSEDHCDKLNRDFVTYTEGFLHCLLNNNEDAIFCLSCEEAYGAVLGSFNGLMSGTEPSKKSPNKTVSCRSRFVDINQLNIVEGTFAYMDHLWNEGVCSDCFVPGCNFTYDCEKSNRTLEFQAAHTKVIECIGRFPKLEACTECSSLYNDLNKKYDEIRLKAENKFCFAIKFWMNKTQSIWTDDTGCCSKRQPPNSDFYVLSAFSIVISIGFYIATLIIGKRNERIQYIPDDLMPPNHQNRLDVTVMNINDAESTTSTNLLNASNFPDGIQSKPTNYGSISNRSTSSSDDNDEDDDIDILPIQNPNLIQI